MNPGHQQETAYHSPFGLFHLSRYPQEHDPTLRAWSAADDYLLHYFQTERLPDLKKRSQADDGRLLVANDTFGALAVCLQRFHPLLWSDSCITRKALEQNIHQNLREDQTDTVSFIPSTDPLPDSIHTVLMQLPKSHHYLRFQLQQLKARLAPGALIVAGTMVKHFHPNALGVFEEEIGETHTTLARKKARLIIARSDEGAPGQPQTDITQHGNRYPLPDGTKLITLPNVFSYDKLDIGTRALLPNIPADRGIQQILDLGCGNGALGIQAARLNPGAKVTFCDESWLAIASARLSAVSAGIADRCDFLVTDALENAPNHQDLILCNPPFHQQNSMHTQIARRMFRQSSEHLVTGGRLLVVGNRHLNYHHALRRHFARVKQIDQNRKFIVLEAIAP